MARLQQCPCGSGNFPEALHDGYNIFMCYVCDDCKAEKLAGFRPDIFVALELLWNRVSHRDEVGFE